MTEPMQTTVNPATGQPFLPDAERDVILQMKKCAWWRYPWCKAPWTPLGRHASMCFVCKKVHQ